MQILTRQEPFDAIVVGSGCTGGWAAKALTEAGMQVALMEAGPKITPKDYTEHVQPYQMAYLGLKPDISRERPIQSLCYACRETNHQWFVNDLENPYTQDQPFHWIRMRVLGGRSLSWGRQSYRMGDIDFKCASRDGYGENWPISYADLKPYYETVEKYVGISGMEEGLDHLPDSVFLPPMKMTCGELRLRERAKAKMGRVVTIGRSAVLTQNHNGRQACHYCGPCEQGCVTNSYFNSPGTTIKDALATGRLTLVTDAPVSHLVMQNGKAAGVGYVDRVTRQPREARAKMVILCASSLESVRILMNSGVGNSSGMLGRFVMDHIYRGGASGVLPDLAADPWAGSPSRPNGIYVPRFRNIDRSMTNGFIRGYGYQGRVMPAFNRNTPGFGKAFKDGVRGGHWTANLGLWAECLPRYENFVEIDKDRVDAWGIPILKTHVSWSDNEKKLFQDGREQAAEMIEAGGGKDVRLTGEYSVPGFCIHEIGGARMSDDPKKGVTNKWTQTHDVDNVFVTDGAVWASSGCQNPTLTMMAITLRTCDYIIKEYSKKLV